MNISTRLQPVDITATIPRTCRAAVESVACGAYHTLLVAGGVLVAFGNNACGQLGTSNPSQLRSREPGIVRLPPAESE